MGCDAQNEVRVRDEEESGFKYQKGDIDLLLRTPSRSCCPSVRSCDIFHTFMSSRNRQQLLRTQFNLTLFLSKMIFDFDYNLKIDYNNRSHN